MKLAIGYHVQDGPWGGGNRFAQALANAVIAAGHQVVFDLSDNDIDIILLTDPRERSRSVSFGPGAILRYLVFRNPRALVLHRVNECDERKGTRRMNAALARANWCADYTIFVGSWLLDLPVWRQHRRTPYSVILNGADPAIFNRDGFAPWDGTGPLRLVTHHWGGNWMKGFDIYQRIDDFLEEPKWKGRIEFTYVGNLPSNFRFKNARVVTPLNGKALADELKAHHAYVTGSINEPGGNHQNEGGACGLPLMYRRSGCLPEYCDGFGLSFDESDFEPTLERMLREYSDLVPKMVEWPHLSLRTNRDYLELFNDLFAHRDEIVTRRRLWSRPWLVMRNQIPI